MNLREISSKVQTSDTKSKIIMFLLAIFLLAGGWFGYNQWKHNKEVEKRLGDITEIIKEPKKTPDNGGNDGSKSASQESFSKFNN